VQGNNITLKGYLMTERRVDESDDDFIVVSAPKKWTELELDIHFTQLQDAIQRSRVAGKPVRVLSDLTKAAKPSKQIENRIRLGNESTFRQGDRVAVLTANDTDKMLLRSMAGVLFAVFSSRIAAEIWLVNDELPRPAENGPLIST
jgi:hypothetical protein